MTLLGGMRSRPGAAVLGAAVIVPSSEFFLVNLPRMHLVTMGVLLGAVVLLMPDGIIPSLRVPPTPGVVPRLRASAKTVARSPPATRTRPANRH